MKRLHDEINFFKKLKNNTNNITRIKNSFKKYGSIKTIQKGLGKLLILQEVKLLENGVYVATYKDNFNKSKKVKLNGGEKE